MVVAGVGYWGVGLPTGYALAFRAGARPLGIWAGLSLGLAAVALLLAIRVRASSGTDPCSGAAGVRDLR
jgi:multidrug resistance protein, MATE family